MKRVVVITLYVLSYMSFLASLDSAAMASMADYVSYPPFVSQSVKPNVMVVLDTSTSMLEFAYQRTSAQWSTDTSDPFPVYDGYFDPSKNYSYSTTYNYFYEDTSGTWGGSLLNFICMRRMDIAKKVLTGGRTAIAGDGATVLVCQSFPNGCGNPDLYDQWKKFNQGGTIKYARHYRVVDPIGSYFYLCDSEGNPSGARFYTRVKITSTPSGIIQDSAPWVRFGLTIYSPAGSADQGGKVLEPCAAGTATHVQNIVSDINRQDMLSDPVGQDTWTPMAETLYTVVGYFRQDQTTGSNGPMYHPGDYQVTDTSDPYYFDTLKGDAGTGKLDCVKSFVIFISDGEANHDSDLPAFLKDTIPSSPPGGVTGTDNYLDDVAYWAHTTDLRTDLTGDQTLTLYTISTFGGGVNLLQSAAKYGGFIDSNGNNLPDVQAEWDENGDGVPDSYFSAGTAEELTDALSAAIQDILSRNTLSHTGAGSAASVISSTRAGEGAVYQAVFYPRYKDKVSWTGEVHAFLVDAYGNLREDTNPPNKTLDLADDLIVVFDSTTPGNVLLYKDVNGDGQLTDSEKTSQPTGFPKSTTIDQLKYLWSTTPWLNGISDADVVTQRTYRSSDQKRYVFTLIDANNNMVADSNEQIDFDTRNYATISPYLHLFNPFTTPPSGFNETTAAQAQINFIRGLDQNKMRNRRYLDSTTGTTMAYRLGDVIDSTPTAVGSPAEGYDLIYRDVTYQSFYTKYRNRRTVVYAGANDGMFHAFNGGFARSYIDPLTKKPVFKFDTLSCRECSPASTEVQYELGAELWAYVPFNLLPHLYWLTRPDYQHVYYCDLKPRVFDAKIFTPDTDHPDGWGTVLVGGMRFGGGRIRTDKDHDGLFEAGDQVMKSAYFILDITNPESPPKVLAEVSFDALGYTTASPGVVVVKDNASATPNNWYQVLGSGPNGARLKYSGAGTFTVGQGVVGQSSGATGVVVSQNSTNKVLTLGTVVGAFQHNETLNQGSVTVTVDLSNSIVDLRDAASSQKAGIYMIDLVQLAQGHIKEPGGTATDLTATSTPSVQLDDNAFVSDIVSADLDLDYKTDVVYFGTVSGQPGSWGGKLRRVVLSDPDMGVSPEDSRTWVKDSLLIDVGKPVSSAPTLAQDRLKQTWVFFGTGRYMTLADASDTSQQGYYGIKEPWQDSVSSGTSGMVDIGGNEMTWSQVSTPNLLNVSSVVLFEGGTVKCDNGLGGLIDCPGVNDLDGSGKVDVTDLEAAIEGTAGWFLDFPGAGERNLGQAALLGDVLSFTTYIPNTQLCSNDEGTSNLWAVYFKTGTALPSQVIGFGSRSFDGRLEIRKSVSLGKGLAPSPNIHTGREQGSKAFIQTSTGTIVAVPEANPGVTKSGKAYWKEESGSK